MGDDYAGPASTDIAMQLFRERKFHDCIKCAEKVIETYPDDAKLYSILGAAYAQSGDRGMSIAAFEHCVAIEPSARGHFNLGKAYEQANRLREAREEYQHAATIDPSYQAAVEALNRLGNQEIPLLQEQTHAHSHLLDSAMDDSASTRTAVHTPTDLNGAAPVSGQTAHTRLDDLQPVGVPIAPMPTAPPPGRLPDLSALEARARENDEKTRQAQRSMIKAGIIYGIIVGPIGLLGASFLLRFRFITSMSLPLVAIEGVVLGAIVGFWVGFTCGDDITGAKVGFLTGLLGHGIPALIKGASLWGVLFQGFTGAVMLCAAGYFIGMMVENSIGQ